MSTGPVVTTNFDRVLETAFRRANRPFEAIVSGAPEHQLTRAFDFSVSTLFKLHGDAEDPERLVLTLSQYTERYGGASGISFRLPGALELILIRRPVLILGCSLGGDRTLQMMEYLAQQHPSIKRFAIIERPPGDKAFHEKLALLSRCGIKPLWYPESQHTAVTLLLSEAAWLASPLGRRLVRICERGA